MRIDDFELERFFARYEFAVRHLLCASDVEGWPMAELLALADPETAALWRDLRLGYTESLGHPLLRREIAALYETIDARRGPRVQRRRGGDLRHRERPARPGDHAIVVWPAYQSLHEVARATGADVTLHELRAADGWAIDVDLLRAPGDAADAADRRQRPAQPHRRPARTPRPTGRSPSIAADAGATLLSDEVYRFLELDPADRLPAGADVGPHGVSIGVMSKSFALAGPADRLARDARRAPARRARRGSRTTRRSAPRRRPRSWR